MRITLESDYALRIISALARKSDIIDAKSLSDEVSVTLRFTLKILHKLVSRDFVKSYKGVNGGYKLNAEPKDITLKDIIELIDGPVKISKCLECEHECSRNPCKLECKMHVAFDAINEKLIENLGSITVRMLHDQNVSHADIADIINLKN